MFKAELIGHLGGDAVVRERDGKRYVSFSVAHTEGRKDPQGNKVSTTTWISVSQGGDGGALFQYLKKGTKVFVRGNLEARTYTDKDNQVRVGLSIYATEINLCGARADDDKPQTTTATAVHQATAQPQPQPTQPPLSTDSTYDDLPF